MGNINLEGNIPDGDKDQSTFSVKDGEEMTMEELVESIRDKIQNLHKKNAINNSSNGK